MNKPDENDFEMLRQEKLFYERFWALHSDPVLTSIFALYGPRVFRRSSVLEGFAAFLERRRFTGETCVEIGSLKGLTAIVLARFFRTVISYDIVEDRERLEIARNVGISNVVFVTVHDNVAKARLINALSQFDAAYVDGNHMADTRSDFDLVKRCGRVLFHEYWQAQQPVWRLVNSLRSNGTVVTEGKLALWTAR